jgi:chemotaxis protein MotB
MGEVIIKVKDVDGGVVGAPLWITTFVDMISLLVTFFILLLTFSSMRDHDAFSYPKSLIGTAGISESKGTSDMVAPNNDIMQAYDLTRGGRQSHARSATDLAENIEDMGQSLTNEHLEIDLRQAASGLRIVFPERAGFAPGSAWVNAPLRKALGEMGRTLQHYPHTVLIEGFTDGAFTSSAEYPDATALSLARATAAAKVIAEESELPLALVQVAGMGTSNPRSSGEDSALERRIDRRVEVVVVAMENGRAKLYEQEVAR